MKIILINGQGGSGKSSVGKALLKETENSAFIDVDCLVATNPWKFGEKTDNLAIKNAVSLVNNFSEENFENIIISGLTRNQELLDKFCGELNMQADILFVWLRADAETRKLRKEKRDRDGADTTEQFELVDKVYPDIESIDIKNGKSFFIDTSSKTVGEVAEEIKNLLK